MTLGSTSPTLERMIRAECGCMCRHPDCTNRGVCTVARVQTSLARALSALDTPDDALIEAMEGAVNAARLNYDGTTGLDKVCARSALRAAVDHILGRKP